MLGVMVGSFEDFCVLHRADSTPAGFTVRKLVENTGQITCQAAAADLESSSALTLSSLGISDISPITLLSNLRTLDISSNSIVELAGIDDLSQLTTLSLANNAIRDVSVIGKLNALTDMDVSGNPVDVDHYLPACLVRHHEDMLTEDQLLEVNVLHELSGVENCLASETALGRLTGVNLSNKQLRSVQYFSVLKVTSLLNLRDNALTDVSALTANLSLRDLTLDGNQISNVQTLQGLRKLLVLRLRGNPIENLFGLRHLDNLEYIDIRNTQVRSIHEFKEMESLGGASLHGLNISYLNFEVYCMVHKYNNFALGIHRKFVEAVIPIAGSAGVDINDCDAVDNWARSLTKLNLNRKDIIRIEPIRFFSLLKELYLVGNRIANLTPIAGLRNLEVLNLTKNRVINFPRLSASRLKKLYLTENFITNVWNISFVASLKTLRIDNNRVTDPRNFHRLNNLTYFDLRKNNISSYPFADAVLNKTPYLKGNPICNITHMPQDMRDACDREPLTFVNTGILNNGVLIDSGLINRTRVQPFIFNNQ